MDLFFNSILQEKIQKFFTYSILNNRLAHAYIFYGERGSGKEAFAVELAKVLNCSSSEKRPCNTCPSCIKINKMSYPDVKFIFPVSKQTSSEEVTTVLKAKAANLYQDMMLPGNLNIPIDTIRDLKSEAKYAAFEAKKRIFIITGADYFSREAANSFLKLLEEPPENLIIILICNDLNALLDTIRSRCQPIHFPRFSDQQVQEIVSRYQHTEVDLIPIIRIAQNDVKRVFQILQEDMGSRRDKIYRFLRAVASSNYLQTFEIIDEITGSKNKNQVLEFLDLLQLWLRDALHTHILGHETEYINLDYSEAIIKFSGLFHDVDYDRLIFFTDQTRTNIERNAHSALALAALAVEIKKQLTVRTPLKEVTTV